MKREKFISTMLLSIPALSFANVFASRDKKNSIGTPNKKGIVIRADESRYNGKQTKPENAFLHCKLSSTDTNEALFIQTSTPRVFEHKGGPPPHIHEYEDEIIYIVSGEFIVHMDGRIFP